MMRGKTPIWAVLCCVALSACGEVKAPGTDAGGPDGSTIDGAAGLDGSGQADAAGEADATAGPDGMVCTGNADCDNGVFCDGVETCGGGGACVAGAEPDCGVSDVCFSRYCGGTSDQCEADPLEYPISYSFTGGPSGDVTLGCSAGMTVHVIESQCPTGAPVQLRLICEIDDSGRLHAVANSTNVQCLPSGAGPFVTTGCSVYGDGQTNFSCCWP